MIARNCGYCALLPCRNRASLHGDAQVVDIDDAPIDAAAVQHPGADATDRQFRHPPVRAGDGALLL
ncbi:hypothetical protein [Nocardia sp. NPDC004604]|uniref:hypothetical protein n=1 Tax=Nocardia sp. NPDC004604 TaxID=3157013 RepID=UPI0033B71DEF